MGEKKTLTKEELEARRLERSAAKHCKSVVYELEKTNRKHIYVFKSTNNWYKIGGRSALFFKYLVAPRLKAKCELRTDRDFYYNFKDGIIPVKDPAVLEEKLKTLKIYKKGVEPEYIEFEMVGAVSEEQIKEMRSSEKALLNKVNEIINPEHVLVRTMTMARVVQGDIFDACRTIDEKSRELMGRDAVYVALRIMDNVMYACRGDISFDKLKTSVKTDAALLTARVTLLIDKKRIELKNGVKVLEHLETLERTIRDETSQAKKKEASGGVREKQTRS